VKFVNAVVRATNIEKRFGATIALHNAALEVQAGRVHALLGENGAGKSTMMKILAGFYRPDRGELAIDGTIIPDFTRWNTRAATHIGVVAVYQELSLPPHLTVAENLFLGVESSALSLTHGLLSPKNRMERARELLEAYDLSEIDPSAVVGELSLAVQQMVEVVKALARRPRILLLDEATSSLPDDYVEKLFNIIQRVKAEGVAVVFISHRLDEVDHFADRATVFRDGTNVGSLDAPFDRQMLIEMMAGHSVEGSTTYLTGSTDVESPVLISTRGVVLAAGRKPINVDIHAGEVVGVAGLEGHGQQEFLLTLFGAYQPVSGTVRVDGKTIAHPTPRRMIRRKVALVPQNRKTEALHLQLSIQENVALMNLTAMATLGWINSRRERAEVNAVIDKLAVRRNRIDEPASMLSGGNQQKLVFAKVMLTIHVYYC
jgi:ribose transport system ATP-binding protein